MANANSKGAPAPDQPEHPFIKADDPEETANSIDCVLAYMHQGLFAEIENEHGSLPTNVDHLCGQLRILEGLRSAVAYLSHLDAAPFGNVTKLEVGNE